ncbi:MAG TPA: OsmC family protein [Gemmatimonadaceae bacterium]|nr:OsmC family protein [Gemmatimonadaceae bacterium]
MTPRATGTTSPEKRPPNRVEVTWAGGGRFDAGRPGGPTLRLDGDGATGQSPVDAVLSALGACTSIDVVAILAKRRTPVERYSLEVSGERAEGTPRRIIAIDIAYRIDGAAIEREHAERAIELAIGKYCSVRDSLAKDIPVRWTLTLNGSTGPARTT